MKRKATDSIERNENKEQVIVPVISRVWNMPSKNTHVYSWEWDGVNELGQKVPTGNYILQLTNGQETKIRKVTMVK